MAADPIASPPRVHAIQARQVPMRRPSATASRVARASASTCSSERIPPVSRNSSMRSAVKASPSPASAGRTSKPTSKSLMGRLYWPADRSGAVRTGERKGDVMVNVALLVRLEAKPGKETEVADFLRQGLALVEEEPDTVAWFGIQLGPSTFGIFDAFP